MKKITLFIGIIILLISCTDDDKYVTINGKVERIINGDGIPGQIVNLKVRQAHGSGQYGTYFTDIELKQVTTDSNGKFSVIVKSADRMFVEVFKSSDENYATFELKSFNPNNNIILGIHKYVKFKVYVKNINPFDSNDYIKINWRYNILNSKIFNLFYKILYVSSN